MGHHHHHHGAVSFKNVAITVLLNIIITVSEIIGGIFAHSLALLSDGIHNLSDAISGIITLGTLKLSQKEHTKSFTFGYKRGEILAALFNASFIIAIAIYLFFEAYKRFLHPEIINGSIMLWVALIGLVANWLSVFLLHSSAKHSLNVRSEYLHLLGDALSSLGVVLGGIFIYFFHMNWLDPLLTVLIGLFIIKEAYEIIKESIAIVMECAPDKINIDELKKDVESIPGVNNIHHLHVWQLSDDTILLESHVDLEKDVTISEAAKIRKQIEDLLREKYGISHTTLQIEYNEHLDEGLIKKVA